MTTKTIFPHPVPEEANRVECAASQRMLPQRGMEGACPAQLRRDLSKLASFAANIADAHSSFVFLPTSIVAVCQSSGFDLGFAEQRWGRSNRDKDQIEQLYLCAYHSLSAEVLAHATIPIGAGIIGWCAKHHSEIHISPFERDSSSLGVYACEHGLKSFVAVPICFGESEQSSHYGVLACDSKKSFAFAQLQIKLLRDLTVQIVSNVHLHCASRAHVGESRSWDRAAQSAGRLVEALGLKAIEAVRITPINFSEVEVQLGTQATLSLYEQLLRLIEQALPPHYTCYQLVNGDVVIVLDNMMTSFFVNKIEAISEKVVYDGVRMQLAFSRASTVGMGMRQFDFGALVSGTSGSDAISCGDARRGTKGSIIKGAFGHGQQRRRA